MQRSTYICHSPADRDAAEIVCAGLEASGIGCRIVPRDAAPGRPSAVSITDAIARSKVVVLVVSHRAVAADEIVRQLEWALSTRTAVCPVRISHGPVTKSLAILVNSFQWLDAGSEPFERHLPAIINAVRRLLADGSAGSDYGSLSSVWDSVRESASAVAIPSDIELQRDTIAGLIAKIRAIDEQFESACRAARESLRIRNCTAARQSIQMLARLKPWDDAFIEISAVVDRWPRRLNPYAWLSPVLGFLSLLAGGLSYGILANVPGVSERVADIGGAVMFLTIAVISVASGIRAVFNIRRRPYDYRGTGLAWFGIAIALGMLACSVITFSSPTIDSTNP